MNHTHVHIGAGRFGLGMVLDVCQQAGFKSIALHRATEKAYHQTLRSKKFYKIIYDNNLASPRTINANFHYYQSFDHSQAVNLLAEPSVLLITTSVTADGLRDIAPLLARALEIRKANNAGPVCVIACENLRQNSQRLRNYVQTHVAPETGDTYFRDSMIFCDTVVDRVCAEVTDNPECPQLAVESFWEWIVQEPSIPLEALDKLGQLSNFKRARNSAEFETLETRKYWCFNGAHLAAAAYAYNYASETNQPISRLSDALEKNEVVRKLKAVQEELAFALRCFARTKGVIDAFPADELREYNERIFLRMQLNKEDRFAQILKHAEGEVKSMRDALRMLDLHEFLDRVVGRIVGPQTEIVRLYDQLLQTTRDLWPAYELATTAKCPRLQLDETLQEIVVATERYSAKAHEDVRANAARFLRENPSR